MEKITISGAIEVGKYSDQHSMTQQVIVRGGENMVCSDGYHTFDELYDHRITLYIALCKAKNLIRELFIKEGVEMNGDTEVWRSKYHSDGELCFGTGTQFVMGIGKEKGNQITYHIPIERWDETDFAETLDKAPEWDGHSSQDVIARLKSM